MSFCPNCGKEVQEGVSFCQNCGANLQRNSETAAQEQDYYNNQNCQPQYRQYQQQSYYPPVRKSESGVVTAAKVLMILTAVAIGWTLIPLAWIIPMTVSLFNKSKTGEKVSTGFKVCTLLFVNVIAGILLLCDDTI